MFSFIRRMFGKGTIRVEMTTSTGGKGIGKIPYEGDISTLDPKEIEQDVIRQCLMKYGERVVEVKILGWY